MDKRVCCRGKPGFCGTTDEISGNTTFTRPSCDAGSQSITRVIGYYLAAGARRSCGGMTPQGFPQGVYSHINFAFGSINPDTYEIIPNAPADEDLYRQLAALHTRDLGQELWLSVGGWHFSESGAPTATTFSDLVNADITHQNVFFASLTLFMQTWGFTGIDIDWEYPAADGRNGHPQDYAKFPKFLANLKSALREYKFGLSITLPTSYRYLQHFDLVAIEPSVDWFNFMSYDLNGTGDIGNQWTGAYLGAHTNLTEIKTALDSLWRNKINPSKVNLGLAFYGRSFTLQNASCTKPGCPYLSAGDAGRCSGQAGILFGSEITTILKDNDLTPTLYKDAAVKTVNWNGDQWVSYDDEDTWKIKADFVKTQCLGGVIVWSVDYDDSSHSYSKGLAAALGNPLNVDSSTGITNSVLESPPGGSGNAQGPYCHFVNCGESCPAGYTQVTRGNETSQVMVDETECPSGKDQAQFLCCPTSTDIPSCQWRGFHNNGKCKGGCNSGEADVGSITAGCRSGYQSACCTASRSTDPWTQCQWTSGCQSDDSCPSDYPNFVVGSRNGWGGLSTCKTGQNYNYCCQNAIPNAFTNCDWHGHQVSFNNSEFCSNACPAGTIRIAAQTVNDFFYSLPAHTDDCSYGREAYCCSGPQQPKIAPHAPLMIYKDQTAKDFDAYLQKFLKAPFCPADYPIQDSPHFSVLAVQNSKQQPNVDQFITLEFLVPLISTWLTSEYPRPDLTDIWNNRLKTYGYGSSGANSSLLEDTLYGGRWSSQPIYSPLPFVSDLLCNIANSEQGVQGIEEATQALCTIPFTSDPIGESKSIWPRRLVATTTNDRSANGVEPSVALAIRGILAGDLTLHYLRWIGQPRRGNTVPSEIILELAFWIGNTPGVAPTPEHRDRFRDRSHNINMPGHRDRWIVFHFHIPLDSNTLLNQLPGMHLGVSHAGVYHSQAIYRDYSDMDWRADYRFSPSYAHGLYNGGTRMNYNIREQILSCPTGGSNPPQRWYPGFDYSDNINQLRGISRNVDYATLLNEFGLFLNRLGVFEEANLAYIWPETRLRWVKGLNFGGTSDWAIDLDANYGDNDGPGKGDDGTIGKGESGSTGNVIISPDIYSQKGDAQVSCQPPCNFVFPPWMLDQPTTISPPKATLTYFENWSTTITISGTAITTTVSSVTTTSSAFHPLQRKQFRSGITRGTAPTLQSG
ncbi:hypothetical protein HDV64DRAFT_272901 [Trichoderma sp. TUCIM 5745]